MKKILFFTIFIILGMELSAQLAMGKWRTHLAYNNVSQIAQSENKVYAVSEGALYSVDKYDGGLEFYSKVSGLNGTDILRIEFDSQNQQLIIIYKNGNIDIMGNGGVVNIPDLYNKQMSANKAVNHIQLYQDKAYLSCDFGIVVLNLKKKEIADTYFIGPNGSEVKVLATTVYNDSIYALTSTKVYRASIYEPFLVNYEFWDAYTDLPGSGDFQMINSFAENLILLRNGKLYKRNISGVWSEFMQGETITGFVTSNTSLNVFTANSVFVLNSNFYVKSIPNVGKVSDAKYDVSNDTYWLAANALGVISYKENGTNSPEIKYYKPLGPAVNSPWNMTFSGSKLFVVPGGRWSSQDFRDGDIMIYENGIWKNVYASEIFALTQSPVRDFMNVAVDPIDNKHFYVTSYGTGLYEFKNDNFIKWYNYTNSTIEGHPLVPNKPNEYSRLDGAIFDQHGNLFFVNCAVSASIKVRLADETWQQLQYPNGTQETLGTILINKENPNQKWVLSVRSSSIIVFDDNGTITDQSDDKSVTISSFNYPETDANNNVTIQKKIPGAVYTIDQDQNGTIWVGTDIGPFLFNNTSNVYDSEYTCSRVKIPRDDSTGLADYLLQDETIKAVAVDGANRKWIGTKNSGVYLMSENGQTQIEHFTTENSPLLSNDILSIAINPITGEVFFGTGNGLVSYQSDAAESSDNFTNVYAYPNPVRENYNGIITVTGLIADTQVKITDLNGNLICQTISNGSIATWDGKDVHGRKVNTGVYLVICVNSDGSESTITKIMVIN